MAYLQRVCAIGQSMKKQYFKVSQITEDEFKSLIALNDFEINSLEDSFKISNREYLAYTTTDFFYVDLEDNSHE